MATTANDMSTDDKILRQLNDDYIHSDQNSDVARYEEFFAEDLAATLPTWSSGTGRSSSTSSPSRAKPCTPIPTATQRKWMCVAGEIVAKGE